MTIYVYIATSLDGFIASQDGGIDWLMEIPNPDQSDYGFSEFIDKIDAVVMGRNTFEIVHSFQEWPYTKPVFVLSNTLHSLPNGYEERAELINGDPISIVKYLNERGYNDLYIDGGKVIQGFLEKDLVDEMIITRVSVLLGNGIPLFKDLKQILKFRHERTIVYTEDLVKSHYKRIRD
jgi:dihydrofolate reductase